MPILPPCTAAASFAAPAQIPRYARDDTRFVWRLHQRRRQPPISNLRLQPQYHGFIRALLLVLLLLFPPSSPRPRTPTGERSRPSDSGCTFPRSGRHGHARRGAARGSPGRVEQEVGFTIEEKIDVLVMDPLAVANGSAWPLLGSPRLVLWTNPPEPDSVIGPNRDWVEMLASTRRHISHICSGRREALSAASPPRFSRSARSPSLRGGSPKGMRR